MMRCSNDCRRGDPELDGDEKSHGVARYCSICLRQAEEKGRREAIAEMRKELSKAMEKILGKLNG